MKVKISFCIGSILFIGLLILNSKNELLGTIEKISLGLMLAGIVEFLVFIIENRSRWRLLITAVYKRNKPVRVTVAYLFRIEENGKYLLIKRHKKDNPGFQPVGGAYKYLKDENRELFDSLGIEPCNQIERDEDTEHDLRIVIKKRKNLIEFLKWFESRKNREIDPYREFVEELVTPGLLPGEDFKTIKYVYIGKHIEGVLKSPVYPIDELRYADIFELRPDSDKQKEAIRNLKHQEGEILFASPDEIRKHASNKGDVILSHSFKILPK